MEQKERSKKDRVINVIFFILLFMLIVEVVFFVARKINNKKIRERILSLNDTELTAKIIKNMYVFDTPYTEEELCKYPPEEQLKLIGDDYAQYLTQDGYEKRMNSINLKFIGLGFHSLLIEEDDFEVQEILPNSPVEEAGLKVGDKIIAIDGKSIKDMTILETISLLEKDEPKKSIFTIQRDNEIFDVSIIKRLIRGKSVKSKMLDKDIGYMKLYQFSSALGEEFIKELDSLLSQNMTKLILDLRGNSGGEVHQIIPIASALLDNSIDHLFTIKYRNIESEYYNRQGEEKFSGPIVVLCNENTASASELLINILKDYDRCKTVGKKTYGKEVSQDIYTLNSKNTLILSTGLPLAPNEEEWHKKGIIPDFDIPMDKNSNDAQLDKALLILKE